MRISDWSSDVCSSDLEKNACVGIAKLSAVIGPPFLAPSECWRRRQRQLHAPHGQSSLCAEFPSYRHRPSSQTPTNLPPSGYKRGIPCSRSTTAAASEDALPLLPHPLPLLRQMACGA